MSKSIDICWCLYVSTKWRLGAEVERAGYSAPASIPGINRNIDQRDPWLMT